MTYLIPVICLIRFSPWFSLSEVCIRRVIAVPMSVYKVVAWSNAVLTIIAYRGSHRLRGYKGGSLVLQEQNRDMSLSSKTTWTIGVISDTHGLLRPEAIAALEGADRIIHAGDIGDPAILSKLAAIAPLTAVRGNVDREAWAKEIPASNVLEVEKLSVYVLHNLNELDLNPKAAGFAAVVSGHTHQPKHDLRNEVLYFNPGSAGPRRFKLPITVGRLLIKGGKIESEVIELLNPVLSP